MTNFETVKVCVLGVSTVGKTCIAARYVQDTYNAIISPTLGAAFLSRYCSAPGGTVFKFQIWDTAGQERYKTLAPLYYRGASVILIVYDMSQRDTFTLGAKDWVKELEGKGLDRAQWVLVGNKQDLARSERQVLEEEASQYAKDIGAMFYETSAKTGYNIINVFNDIACRLEQSKSSKPSSKVKSESEVIKNPEKEEKKHPIILHLEKHPNDFPTQRKVVKKCCHS